MKTIKYMLSAVIAISAISCQEVNEKGNNEHLTGEELRLSANLYENEAVVTRANIAFADGEDFHVIVKDKTGTYFSAAAKEVKATTQAPEAGALDRNGLTLTPTLYWDDLGGKLAQLELFGVYPYYTPQGTSTATVTTGSELITWTVSNDLDDSDLRRGHLSSYLYSKTAAAYMVFEHVLTKISIKLEPGDGTVNLAGATVTYTVPGTATYNYISNTLTTVPVDVTLPANPDEDGLFSILAFPKTVMQGSSYKIADIVTLAGNTYEVMLKDDAKDIVMAAGVHNTYTVTVNKSSVSVTGSVVDWATGDGGSASSKLIEPDDVVIADGTTTTKLLGNDLLTISVVDANNAVKSGQYKYDLSGTKWNVVATKELYWDDVARPLKSVSALIQLGGGTSGEAILTSKKTGSFGLAKKIDMDPFVRPLAKVSITFGTTVGADKVNIDEITGVTMPAAGFNISGAGVVTNGASTTAAGNTAGYTYVAYIWPSALTTLCDVTIAETSTISNTYSPIIPLEEPATSKSFEAGLHYVYTVEIKKSGATMTGSLKDWGAGAGGNIDTELN